MTIVIDRVWAAQRVGCDLSDIDRRGTGRTLRLFTRRSCYKIKVTASVAPSSAKDGKGQVTVAMSKVHSTYLSSIPSSPLHRFHINCLPPHTSQQNRTLYKAHHRASPNPPRKSIPTHQEQNEWGIERIKAAASGQGTRVPSQMKLNSRKGAS